MEIEKIMKIVITASWKQRDRVRLLANNLRNKGYSVYDFTDQSRRQATICPPEKFPDEFDPTMHTYKNYIKRDEWIRVVAENRLEIDSSDLVIMLLPCGIDSTADWAYSIGKGKTTIISGIPPKGERSPTHNWANTIVDNEEQLLKLL